MAARGDERQNLPTSYPTFYPHVTLASFPSQPALTLSEIRAAMPKFQRGLPVKFKSIEIGTHFFRSIYIAIELTPLLSALHEEVHAKLAIEPRTPAFPHVSLCYIDDRDALSGERDEFFRELKNGGKIRRTEDDLGLCLNCGGSAEEDWMGEFLVKEVWLAQCDGPVENWTILDIIPIVW